MTAAAAVRMRGQRIWTDEQKAAQSARLRALKPWVKSTGPRSVQGKKTVAKNALKHGMRSAKTIEFKRYLRWQKGYLARAVAAFKRRRFLRKLLAACTKILQDYGKLTIQRVKFNPTEYAHVYDQRRDRERSGAFGREASVGIAGAIQSSQPSNFRDCE